MNPIALLRLAAQYGPMLAKLGPELQAFAPLFEKAAAILEDFQAEGLPEKVDAILKKHGVDVTALASAMAKVQ